MHHITYTERLQIEKYYSHGLSYSQIADKLHRHKSTIYREIKRGLYDRIDPRTYETYIAYSADIADADALFKATAKGCPLKLGKRFDYVERVSQLVHSGLSVDSIVGLFRVRGLWTVSTPTLYRYIDMGLIPDVSNSVLPEKSKRKSRAKKSVRPSRCPSGFSIESRPDISDRLDFGHWEMDSVCGKSSGFHESILVLTERKTRYEIIVSVDSKTAKSTVDALSFLPLKYGPVFKTVTVDNGPEFSDPYGISSVLSAALFYCHPYSSFERGSNERNNRLIRRYLPKGKSLSHITQADCDFIAYSINSLPRKILEYSSSNDVFSYELRKMNISLNFFRNTLDN